MAEERSDTSSKQSQDMIPQPRMSLIEARKTCGLSQQDVAERIGSTLDHVHRWELGMSRPSPYFRQMLCTLFGKTEAELDLVSSSQDEHALTVSSLDPPIEPESSIPEMHVIEERQDAPGALYDPAIPLPPLFALIGREEDLVRIKQRLQVRGNAALTVLNGLPGVGKTALSIALAYDLDIRTSFSDGVLWAGLGPNPNIASLLSRWGTLVGLSITQMATLRGNEAWVCAIRAVIGTRKMLLVIDDAWQFEDAQTLRVGGPNCVHLVTTRFPAIATQMTVAGAITIQELNEEHSMHLLNRLAPQVVSYETQKVQDLVQAVGGLPLALTLLGNYLRKQAYNGPIRRITAALEHLNDAEVRLQINEAQSSIESYPSLSAETSLSLQSVIAVTDQLLPASVRLALYMLSIFPPKPHTFSEDAALAVTDKTLHELDILCDTGLLESNGDRYMLHQVIADYAHLHLHNHDAHAASGRLITYIANFVETHTKDYDQLEQESSIIRVALETAIQQDHQPEIVHIVYAFAPFLILRGFYQEAEQYLRRAYEAAQALQDVDGITGTLLYLGEIEQRQSNYAQAEDHLQQGLILARQIHNDERICALLTQLGIVLQHQGNFQQAETVYQEGLMLARNLADDGNICVLLNNLGWLNVKRGEFACAQTYLQEGLALARKIGDRERVCALLRMLGTLAGNRGEFVQAETYLQEGLIIARQLRDSEQMCAHLISLGAAIGYQGKNTQAKSYYQEALKLAEQIGHREYICIILSNLGDVFVEENNYNQAEISFQEGLALARQISHREWISDLLINLGMITQKQGHYDRAKRYLEESLELAHQIEKPRIMCTALCELGTLALSEGKLDVANDYFQKMRDITPAGDQELLALADYGMAQVWTQYGEMKRAQEYAEKSITALEIMKHRKASEVRDWIQTTF